ncbi:MAG: hypothetical protein Q6370_002895 [Candidatus Sigynarchaeota archaeon]
MQNRTGGSSQCPGTVMRPSAIEGTSKPLAIMQQATVTRSFYPLSLPTDTSFLLVSDWRSKNVTIDFSGVSHYKDWIANGAFTGSIAPWVFKTTHPTDLLQTSSSGIAQITLTTNKNLPANAYAFFEENVTIPEPLVSNKLVSVSMDYNFDDGAKTPPSEMSLIISITISGVEKNVSVPLTNLVVGAWTGLVLTYNPQTVGHVLPGLAIVRVGIYTYDPARTASLTQRISLDNVRFNIWTSLNQNGALIVRDNEFNQNYSYQNITLGTGRAFIDVQRSRATSSDVVFTIFKNPVITEAIEVYNITVNSFVEKQFNSTVGVLPGSQYYTEGSSVNWTTYLHFVTPFNYMSQRALIVKPPDWMVFSITNGFGINRLPQCVGTGIGSTTVVIPKDILYDGLWKLEATSANYVIGGNIQVWNAGSFVNKTSVFVGDVFRVTTRLNGSLSLTGSSIACTIFYPNNSVYFSETRTPSSSEVLFGNFTVDASKPVGPYRVQVNWTNDLDPSKNDKIGLIDLEFQVIHHANITAVTSFFQRVPGEPLLVKVKVMDTDANLFLPSADVMFNTSYGISGTMTYFGAGVYAAEIDTTALAFGDHYFSFNASKAWYMDCHGTNLVHVKIVSESLKLEVPRDIKTVSANSFAVYRLNLTGSISQMPLHPATITTDWFRPYTITDHANGTYTLNLSTYEATTRSTPETFTITIHASKTNYASTSDIVILTVNPIATSLQMNTTFVEVYAGDRFALKANYTVDSNGSLIPGATLAVTWPAYYQVQPAGAEFVITFNTTALGIGTYTGLLNVTRPGFQARIESFYVVVKPVKTQLIVLNAEPIQFAKGTVGNLSCRYLAGGVDFLGGTLVLMGDITGTFSRAGSTYYFVIDTALYAKGTYFVQVYAYGLNVESYIKDVILSIVPIPADGVLNATFLEASFGSQVQLEANYTVVANGSTIAGATIHVNWPSNYTYSLLGDRYVITLDTWNLTMDTYACMVKMAHPDYNDVYENFQVIVRPIKTRLQVDNATLHEFVRGDVATISCSYTASGSPLLGASLSFTGAITGNFTWNGSRYVFTFNTSAYTSKVYDAQIMATRANAETQIVDFLFRIVPLSLKINLTTSISMTYRVGQENDIVFWIADTSHGTNRTDLVVQFTINSVTTRVFPQPNGTYTISINQLNLQPSSDPYLLSITVINPHGENVVSTVTIVYTTQTIDWWLIVIVAGGVSAIFIVAIGIYTSARRRRRRIEAERMDIINKARDLFNLNNIIVLDKRSGIDIFGQTYGEFKLDPTLVSGFLSAIGTFGLELTNTDEDSQTIKLEYKKSKIVISEFKGFRITMIMKDAPSSAMLASLDRFAHDIEEKYGKLLQNFNGETTAFQDMGKLIEKHFHVSFVAPLKINPRPNVKLTQDEKLIYNKANDVAMAKGMQPFYASEIFASVELDHKAVEAFFSLMNKGIITPAE